MSCETALVPGASPTPASLYSFACDYTLNSFPGLWLLAPKGFIQSFSYSFSFTSFFGLAAGCRPAVGVFLSMRNESDFCSTASPAPCVPPSRFWIQFIEEMTLFKWNTTITTRPTLFVNIAGSQRTCVLVHRTVTLAISGALFLFRLQLFQQVRYLQRTSFALKCGLWAIFDLFTIAELNLLHPNCCLHLWHV